MKNNIFLIFLLRVAILCLLYVYVGITIVPLRPVVVMWVGEHFVRNVFLLLINYDYINIISYRVVRKYLTDIKLVIKTSFD